jgi:hypothetical protein
MLLKKSKYRQRVIDKAAFAAGFVAPANVAGFHLELLQIEAALLKYLSLWEATVGAHAGDVSISWRAPLEICDIIGTHCDENDDFVLFYNKNYYLIILQYKHTYNNNKAQLLIFIKDIMYYTMDPSCAKPGTKMDT